MKKFTVIAAALLAAANFSLFAQATVTGQVQYRGLYTITTAKDGAGDAIDPSFRQSIANSGTQINLAYTGDNVKAFLRANSAIALDQAWVTWTPGPVSLTAGYLWNPIVYLSDISFDGDGNAGYGALAISKGVQLKLAAKGFYAGVYTDNGDVGTGTDTLAPGFYAGYDLEVNNRISFGIAGQGFYNAAWEENNVGFAGAVHAKLNFGAPTIKLNAGYVKNDGFTKLRNGKAAAKKAENGDYTSGEDFLEGFLGLNYKANDAVSVQFAAGLVLGLEDDTDPVVKLTLDLPWKTSLGVSVIPGVFVVYGNKDKSADKNTYLDIQPGLTVSYSF